MKRSQLDKKSKLIKQSKLKNQINLNKQSKLKKSSKLNEKSKKSKKSKKSLNILILGPQGCGKGTQAQLISKKFNLPHIPTGAIFREYEKKETPLGKEIKRLIDHGLLAPDELTNEVVSKRLSQKDCKKGYILDGYPRNFAQAHFLENLKQPSFCIFIQLSEEGAIRRISARRSCALCNANYNLLTSKPKKDGVCDRCSGTLISRPDDKPAAIKRRLKEYHLETEGLVDYYKQKNILKRVNGEQNVEEIFKEILLFLK